MQSHLQAWLLTAARVFWRLAGGRLGKWGAAAVVGPEIYQLVVAMEAGTARAVKAAAEAGTARGVCKKSMCVSRVVACAAMN